MRILLALMFFTPVIAFAAVQRGVEAVTPVMIAFVLVAMVAQFLVERRAGRS